MPTDYDKIREDNIRGYGEHTHHLAWLDELYAERTHFVFELLQNAEDAGATQILFGLFHDRLEVTHNGRLFDERDVRGICGVGAGTKTQEKLTQIGRFGLGFKSVYAYTRTPEIHSGSESFKIKDYVRPYPAASKLAGDCQDTLFVFPFDYEKVKQSTARQEIGDRLRALGLKTMLFLRNIEKIEYRMPNSEVGTYQREEISQEYDSGRKVRVIHQDDDWEEESWLIFERTVTMSESSGTGLVEVSFLLETEKENGDASRQEYVAEVPNSPLIAHFPTEKETRLGFLIQGPYRTTPARDNIPKDDKWNKTLIQETAELIGDILPKIKKHNLLSASFLNVLPIRSKHFLGDNMFRPIFEAVRNKLRGKDELLPAVDASFVSVKNAKLARGNLLRELLSPAQLGQLFQPRSQTQTKWITGEITADSKPDLHSYIKRELGVEEVTPEDFGRRISGSFLSDQPDSWLIDFYRCLSQIRTLGKMVRSKPIIRLESGDQVLPYKSDNTTPNAFLPSSEEIELPVVKRSIADDEEAREFLKKNMGLPEANPFDYLVAKVLPKYHKTDRAQIPAAEHHEDIRQIARALDSDAGSGGARKDQAIKEIRQTPFLKAINLSGQGTFKKPGEIYRNTEKMRQYFASARHKAWFLSDEYDALDIESSFWKKMGISAQPRKLESNLDGLPQLLHSIKATEEIEEQRRHASILWHFLKHYVEVEPDHPFMRSVIRDHLQDTEWLPTKDGSLVKPSEVTKDQLLDNFLEATDLVEALEIAENQDTEPIEEDIARDEVEEAWTREIATRFGVSSEAAEKLKKMGPERLLKLLDDAQPPPEFPASPVRNLERRQKGMSQQVSAAPKKNYEKRERSVRTTRNAVDPRTSLRVRYTNKDGQMVCQICKKEMPFRKRDRTYYFESMEIFPLEYLPREHDAQFLALCPLCSAKYNEFITHDDDAAARLREKIIQAEGDEIPISLGDEEASIRFVEVHLHDLKVILKKQSDQETD